MAIHTSRGVAPDAHAERAPVGHDVERVHHQVERDLLELLHVALGDAALDELPHQLDLVRGDGLLLEVDHVARHLARSTGSRCGARGRASSRKSVSSARGA
jgi:hypothetical protein